MANKCVNISLPEFKDMVKASGVDPLSLAADISIWQDQNNSDDFPTLPELYGDSFTGSEKVQAKEKLDSKVLDDQLVEIGTKRDSAVKKAIKPKLDLSFIADSEFLKHDNARDLRAIQKELKKEYANLKTLTECLTK